MSGLGARVARGRAKPAAGAIEGPWALPEGWRWEQLGDIGTWSGGGTPSKAKPEFWSNGTIPWVSPKDMKQAVIDSTEDRITSAAVAGSSTKLVAAGSVLCVMRSGILRHTFPVAVAAVDVTLNQDMRALTPPPAIDPFFLAYYLRCTGQTVLETSSKGGTTVNSIEAERLDRHPVPIPTIEVQRAIVARIDELFTDLDDGEAALARARADLGTWRKALLKAAVTGELTADWRAANPPTETGADLLTRILEERRSRWVTDRRNKGRGYNEPTELLATDLPSLPRGWAWASLAQLSSEEPRSFQSGPFDSALLHSEFQQNGKLVIGIDNVKEGYFSLGSNHRIKEEKFDELLRFKARAKDVLVTVMATIGRTCVVPDSIEESIVSKHVYRISPDLNSVMPYFLMNCLRANPTTLRHLFGKAQGQTRPGLNKDILETTPVPLPPYAEQKLSLSSIDDALLPSQNLIGDLEVNVSTALRQSILAAAFREELVA